jgi:3,4-dihydroxy 2-butanone 4-phosphate synthase/GTP cyclohydrolase II
MAFAVRYTSGFLCVGFPAVRCDELGLPPSWPTNTACPGAAYTVTVDASAGISTGISAADRSQTVRLLADERSTPADFTRPGHIVVTAAADTGTFVDRALDLVVETGRSPALVFGAIVSQRNPIGMAACSELIEFADQHELLVVNADHVNHDFPRLRPGHRKGRR